MTPGLEAVESPDRRHPKQAHSLEEPGRQDWPLVQQVLVPLLAEPQRGGCPCELGTEAACELLGEERPSE